MSKLTLSVDKAVVTRAKGYARRNGTSVSKLVESFLDAVSRSSSPEADPPILRSLRGILGKGDRESYRKHLAAKHL